MRRRNLNSISGRVIDDIHSQLKVLTAVFHYRYVITLIQYELRDHSNKDVCPKSAQRHHYPLKEATHYPTAMVVFPQGLPVLISLCCVQLLFVMYQDEKCAKNDKIHLHHIYFIILFFPFSKEIQHFGRYAA